MYNTRSKSTASEPQLQPQPINTRSRQSSRSTEQPQQSRTRSGQLVRPEPQLPLQSRKRSGRVIGQEPQSAPQPETITLNCVFFDPSVNVRSATVPYPIDLPMATFNDRLLSACPNFVAWLRKLHKFKTTVRDLDFYTPTQSINVKDVDDRWDEGVLPTFNAATSKFNINKAHLDSIPFFQSLAETLGELASNRRLLHLVVAATNGTVIDEEEDVLSPLPSRAAYNNSNPPEYDRGLGYMNTKCPTPSSSGSAEYNETQAHFCTAIFDGRQSYRKDAVITVSPPLSIFHPVFERFVRLTKQNDYVPTREQVMNVRKLMDFASVIHDSEREYASKLRSLLFAILGRIFHLEQNEDTSTPDGVWQIDIGHISVPIVVLEVKRELAEGKCDPLVRAGLITRRSWQQRLEYVKQIRCPTFFIAGGGPWLTIGGAVFTDRVIAQPLTDMLAAWAPSTALDDQAWVLARVFSALRDCATKLEEEYNALRPQLIAHSKEELLLSKLYPYPNMFTTPRGKTVVFEYVKAMQFDGPCVTFLAKVIDSEEAEDNGKNVVVKFVDRYGENAHKFLASQGHAPELHYCGPFASRDTHKQQLLATLPPRVPVTTQKLGGLRHGGWFMVVMDYIAPPTASSRRPPNAKDQLEKILTTLHLEGYVFGDLRDPNIVFDATAADKDGRSKVKLIDFDWCGRFDPFVEATFESDMVPIEVKEGVRKLQQKELTKRLPEYDYAHYPLRLSKIINWGGGEEAGPIRPDHDWNMWYKLWNGSSS